jgi:hypothetical protein
MRSILSFIILLFCIMGTRAQISIVDEDGSYVIKNKNTSLVSYRHAEMPPPAGVKKEYTRSGYLHPVNTPSGKALTRIHPKDHYHHFGIWNPWTHVLYKNDTLDFWNIGGGRATVRFAKIVNKSAKKKNGEITVQHDHVVLKGGRNEVAFSENQTIKVTMIDKNSYALDFNIVYDIKDNPSLEFVEYRYGGLGWRATEVWNNENSSMLTSEGKTRKNGDSTRAKWCLVQGSLTDGHGGILMMSNPQNYNYPEPLRIWDEKQHEGSVFANFSPTRNMDWVLTKSTNNTLKYRFLVFDGKLDAAQAEKLYTKYIKSN